MPKIQFPSARVNRWRGIFEGEFSGEIFSGRAIDLERSNSKVHLGESISGITNSSLVNMGNLTTPVGFVRSSADNTDRWWTSAGRLFKTSGTDPEAGWAEDAISGTPTAPLYDLIDFQGALIVPTSTNLDRLSSGTWTNNWWSSLSGASALQSGVPHRFVVFEGALLITDGRFINDYDGTIARDPALTLPAGFEARWMRVWRDLVFIGGANTVGGEAEIFTWRRSLSTFESRYPIGDSEALACFVKDVPYIVTKKGAIKRFDGTGFTEEGGNQFPTVELNLEISSIHPNGILVEEDVAKILVNFGTIANDRVLSGIWTFNARNRNLYHSGSLRNTTGNDYNQAELAGVGALVKTAPTQGSFLAGAQVYTDYNGTTRYGIFSSDESSSSGRGYVMTPKIPAAEVRNYWRYITAKVARFKNSGDRLRVYYRIQDSNELPAFETATFTSSTTFTGSNNDVQVGDLAEVIAGPNAGALERITNIASGTPNTYTINTAVLTGAGDARIRYWRFREVGSIADQTSQEVRFITSDRGNWIQFLIQLVGDEESPALEKTLIEFKPIPV